ncbi:MFS transporter [Streptomyces sp. WAC 01529]|uniref:MDR family MFS transporter n=1 Tax=Streptomyces sp. WAC 01529 TaxID=2203205 RepID=UPI0013E08F31|nr:MFS transporter [Streptomyces sp. WAC 01529]
MAHERAALSSTPEPPPTDTREVLGLPRPFWVLWSGTLCNRVGTFAAPFLVIYMTERQGMSVATAGLLITLQGAGMMVSNIVGGFLADRFQRRLVIASGLFLTTVVLLLLVAADTVAQLACVVVLLGLVGDLHRPGLNALVADLVPENRRVRAYSMLHWASNLGIPVAGVVGGLLSRDHLPLLLVADAATTALFGVVVLLGAVGRPAGSEPVPDRTEGLGPVQAEGVDPSATGSRRDVLLRDPLLLGFLLVTCGVFAVYFQNFTTLPLSIVNGGMTAADYGFAIACNGIVVAVCQPLVLRLMEKHSETTGLVVSYALTCGGFALTGLVGNLPLLIVTVVVWSLGEIGFTSLGPAFVSRLAPERLRARYQGIYGSGISAAALLAPLGGASLYGLGPGVLWGTCAVIGAAAVVTQLFISRAADRRLPAAVKEAA